MNEQQYLCPWCGRPLEITPVMKGQVEYTRLYCSNGTCYDPVCPVKNTRSAAQSGVISQTIDDAYTMLKFLKNGGPSGAFGTWKEIA